MRGAQNHGLSLCNKYPKVLGFIIIYYFIHGSELTVLSWVVFPWGISHVVVVRL